uniref:Uncharacterized protein n=1 Tax=Poecilia mexicana TaxID=48701 RepID=A0A3B3Z3D8_9TELE
MLCMLICRSSEKEEQFKVLVKRLDQIKSLFQQQHKEVSLQYVDEVQQQPHSERRASVEDKETEPLLQRLKEKDEQFKSIRSKLKEQRKETEALQQRLNYEEEQLQNARSALQEKDMKIEDLEERIEDMKNNEQKQHHLRSSMKEKENENEDLKRIIKEKDEQLKLMRIQEKEVVQQKHTLRSLKDKEKETEALKRIINEKDEQLQLIKSTLKEKQKETDVVLQRVHEMEEQLQKSRSALQEKEEQLKSFKDRVAGEVALSIKTGNTMSLNNPVSKNRLKEMYEDLRIDWPKIKSNLKSNNKHPDSVKELILKKFGEAKTEMRNRKMMIDKVFGLNVINTGGIQQKVDQYRQLTVQNLQMTLYSEKQDVGLKKPFLGNEAVNPQDVLEYLGSECFWLGCLMALNNPPLQPDWENHPPSMDRWDFFPRNIRTVSENE